MEPRIELDQRSVTNDQKTYFCSLCGKQLLVLGGFWDKPFWRQPDMIGLWLSADLLMVIDLWESLKNSLKGKPFKKLLVLAMIIIFFLPFCIGLNFLINYLVHYFSSHFLLM